MPSTVTLPPLSVEDFLYTLARTPTATRFGRRRRQAQEKPASKNKPLKTPEPNTNEVSSAAVQSAKLYSTHKEPASQPHPRVEQALSDVAKNAANSAQHTVQQCPSTQEYVLKSTLAAINAITAAHVASLEAFKVQKSRPRSVERPVVVSTPVDEYGDDRFEDAEECELQEVVQVEDTPVKSVREMPAIKVKQTSHRSSRQNAEDTDKAPQMISIDVAMNQNKKQNQSQELPPLNLFGHKQKDESGPQKASAEPIISRKYIQERQEKFIPHNELQISQVPQEQGSILDEETSIVEETLDELDMALLQLGNESEINNITQFPESSQSFDPSESSTHSKHKAKEPSIFRSLKRASPEINDQEDRMDYNQENPISPPKKAKHLVQSLRSPQHDDGLKNFEDGEWSEEHSSFDRETEDSDSTYSPGGLKKKSRNKSKRKEANKSKTGLVECKELDLTSAPKRTPFAAVDESAELKSRPIIANVSACHRLSFGSRALTKVIKKSGVKKKKKKKQTQVKSKQRFFADLGEFRTLKSSGSAENNGHCTSSGAPTYSDGFTVGEAKPIGRVMPISRFRPRVATSARPPVLKMGELALAESRSIFATERVRSQKCSRKEDTRPFRQLKKVDEKEGSVRNGKAKVSPKLKVQDEKQQKERVQKQEIKVTNQELEAQDHRLKVPAVQEPDFQRQELEAPNGQYATHKLPEAPVEELETQNQGSEVPKREREREVQEFQEPNSQSPELELLDQEQEVQAEVVLPNLEIGKNQPQWQISGDSEDMQSSEISKHKNDPSILQDNQSSHATDMVDEETFEKPINSKQQTQHKHVSGDPGTNLPESTKSSVPKKLKRRVTWNEVVDVQRQLLLVTAPIRPIMDSESEESDQENEDEEVFEGESGGSSEESSSDSDSESKSDDNSDTEGEDAMNSSQDSGNSRQLHNESEQDEASRSGGNTEEYDNDSDEDNSGDEESDGNNYAYYGNEKENEDDEMLLESQTIEYTEPLARPDDFVLEEELSSLDDDEMMDVDESGGMESIENMGNDMKISDTLEYQQAQEVSSKYVNAEITSSRSRSSTSKSGYWNQVSQETVWRPRRPDSGYRVIEVDEDILDSSSPSHKSSYKISSAQDSKSKQLQFESKEPSPEIPDSQGLEMKLQDPELSFKIENVSNYFSRASQGLKNEELPLKPKTRTNSISSYFKKSFGDNDNGDDHEDGDDDNDAGGAEAEGNGMISKSQMFQRTLSSQQFATPQPQAMVTRESQMSWRPEQEDIQVEARGNGLRELTRRASAEFGTISIGVVKKRTFSLPFVPPWKKI